VPPPPARLLDLGSGPGRYALTLAGQGYTVTLADLSTAALDFACQQAQAQGITLAGALVCDARDLSALADAAFDAVLLLGPLYHLFTLPDRQAALAEACRVLRPGGVLLAAFITRFAPFRDAAIKSPDWLEKEPEYIERLLETGVHDQSAIGWTVYFAHPGEIILMERRPGNWACSAQKAWSGTKAPSTP
jgi:ubiquinone/menaquinone biosynthesis C-methylase UbiE